MSWFDLIVVASSKASGARGSSGVGGVKSLWACVAGRGGRLIGVEALWACVATIGGGCAFVQAGCAWRTGAIVLGGASEGGSNASVEAPPWVASIFCCYKCIDIFISSKSCRTIWFIWTHLRCATVEHNSINFNIDFCQMDMLTEWISNKYITPRTIANKCVNLPYACWYDRISTLYIIGVECILRVTNNNLRTNN